MLATKQSNKTTQFKGINNQPDTGNSPLASFQDNRKGAFSDGVYQSKIANANPRSATAQLISVMNGSNDTARQTIQRKSNMPENLQSGIESMSGYSMDDVNVHYNSPKPAQLQAHAYAQGTDIHLAQGQEKHLPHEAWHVVQQKQGRVQPTMQMKSVAINDDSSLEREADVMGVKALQAGPAIQGKFSEPSSIQLQSINGEGVLQGFFGLSNPFSGLFGGKKKEKDPGEQGIEMQPLEAQRPLEDQVESSTPEEVAAATPKSENAKPSLDKRSKWERRFKFLGGKSKEQKDEEVKAENKKLNAEKLAKKVKRASREDRKNEYLIKKDVGHGILSADSNYSKGTDDRSDYRKIAPTWLGGKSEPEEGYLKDNRSLEENSDGKSAPTPEEVTAATPKSENAEPSKDKRSKWERRFKFLGGKSKEEKDEEVKAENKKLNAEKLAKKREVKTKDERENDFKTETKNKAMLASQEGGWGGKLLGEGGRDLFDHVSSTSDAIDNVKGLMTGLVKEVQADEAKLMKRDIAINGDAAVNAHFGDQKALESESDHDALVTQAKESLSEKYQGIVLSGDKTRFDVPEITSRKQESWNNANESKVALEKTATDRSIVEMFWNQIDAESKKTPEKQKEEGAPAVVDKMYQAARARQFNIKERVLDADFQNSELAKEGRIADMWEAIGSSGMGNIFYNTLLSTLSAGIVTVKGHKDKRGFLGKTKDFEINLEDGTATEKDLLSNKDVESGTNQKMGGGREWETPMQKWRNAKAEFDAKTANRKSDSISSNFTWLAQGVDLGKKMITIAKSIVSGFALWFTGMSFIPGFQFAAPVATILGTISYYMSLVTSGFTVLKGMFDGLAQITNDNPALFLELEGESTQSGFNLVTEGLTYGATKVGLDSWQDNEVVDSKSLVNKSSDFNYNQMIKDNATAEAGPNLGSKDWFNDQLFTGANVAAGVGGNVLNKVLTNELSAATGANMRTYDMSQDEDRRINKKQAVKANTKPDAQGDKYKDGISKIEPDAQDADLIKMAYETTLKKSTEQSAKYAAILGKVVKEPVPVANPSPASEVSEQDAEAAAENVGFVDLIKDGVARLSDFLKMKDGG